MTLTNDSIFGVFNARSLTPSDVAKTFVPSPTFDRISAQRHTLVLGPRGSGKTTLLKMLQAGAIESWQHTAADAYAKSIAFTGIFVPFDRSWKAQLDALGVSGGSPTQLLLSTAAFTTHLFRSVLTAFLGRISTQQAVREFRRVSISPSQHTELARLLYMAWRLPEGPKSLLAVRSALGARLTDIGNFGYRTLSDPSVTLDPTMSMLGVPSIEGVAAALDAWESVLEHGEEKWALLFDELELAPLSIKRELYSSLRSRDSRLLFKLALSPFDGEVPNALGPEDPQPGQDYDAIELWFTEKRDPLSFCGDLWRSVLTKRGLPYVAPKAIFGKSNFVSTQAGHSSQEAVSQQVGAKFSQLSAFDGSFQSYLSQRSIDPNNLTKAIAEGKGPEIRKIAPIVEARLFFRKEGALDVGPSSVSRSRKRMKLYAGWETLCAVSEGNPRLFIGMISELLGNASETATKVSHARQAEVIESTASRYVASLRTIPVTSPFAKRSKGLASLLDTLGRFFHRKQIVEPFSGHPPGSFVVDPTTSRDLVHLIGQAVNFGALVLTKDSEHTPRVNDLIGRRLRLCYLLSAYHRTMPRQGRPVGLTRILTDAGYKEEDLVQLELR